jgi:hypothetical protein
MNQRPPIFRIIGTDYTALQGAVFPIVFLGLYVVLPLLGERMPSSFIYIALAVTVIALAVLTWRYRLILSIFDDGQEVSGTISNIVFFRDRGTISYIYTYQGQKFESYNPVLRNKRTRALKIGDEVALLVDRNHPKRAFIRDLYL